MTGDVQRWYNEHIRERLLERTELMPSGCLAWTGATVNGYGCISYKGARHWVHRLIWELEHGPIPGALTIDHVRARGCIHTLCINIDHLEVVTRAENSRRGALWRWQRIRDVSPHTVKERG
jgi:hypothetical protein